MRVGKGEIYRVYDAKLGRWIAIKVTRGLKPRTVEETIRDNADSLLKWGLVKTRPGEDNWQREGNDLGIKSKWRPHTYPALDPELKSKLEAQTTARAS